MTRGIDIDDPCPLDWSEPDGEGKISAECQVSDRLRAEAMVVPDGPDGSFFWVSIEVDESGRDDWYCEGMVGGTDDGCSAVQDALACGLRAMRRFCG